MTDRIPHVSEQGDSKYTILKEYDHIIASLDITIENILRANTLINEKNSISLPHLNKMKDNYEDNVITLVNIKRKYIQDRDSFESQANKNILYHD